MNGMTIRWPIGCCMAVTLVGLFSSCGLLTQQSGGVHETTVRSETYKPRSFEQLDGFFKDGLIPGDTIKWQDDASVQGDIEIVVDKKKQMGYFYRGDQLMGYFPVCTGKHSVSTPEGEFKILAKNSEHRSCYGQFVSKETGKVTNGNADIRVQSVPAGQTFVPAEMPFFMRIKDTVGIHQGFLPGHPASHGCIRIPDFVAGKLFNVTPVGTKVTIKGDLGKDFFVKREAEKAARAAAKKAATAAAAITAAASGAPTDAAKSPVPSSEPPQSAGTAPSSAPAVTDTGKVPPPAVPSPEPSDNPVKAGSEGGVKPQEAGAPPVTVVSAPSADEEAASETVAPKE